MSRVVVPHVHVQLVHPVQLVQPEQFVQPVQCVHPEHELQPVQLVQPLVQPDSACTAGSSVATAGVVWKDSIRRSSSENFGVAWLLIC